MYVCVLVTQTRALPRRIFRAAEGGDSVGRFPSVYLRSCRSRFSSVSSGDSVSSLGSPGEKTVPFCATWKAIISHHPHPSLPPDPPAGVYPSVQCGWPPPPDTPLPVERVRLRNVDRPLLSNPPPPHERSRLCNVGQHLLTSLSRLLLHSPQTHLQDDSPVGGIDFPRDPPRAMRTAPQPARASRPATCVSPGAPGPASRHTPVVVFIPATLPPTPPSAHPS
jgi:hypothetical protein